MGLVDVDDARARRVRDEIEESAASCAVHTSLVNSLDETAPDGVVIATPPDSHHALVSECFERGIHVLCEKPLSDDMNEVVDLISKAHAAHLHLMVGMNFRYLPTSQRIRHYARSGELGALSHAQFAYQRHRDGNRDDLNDYVMEMLHPLLLEQSIHHFDLLRYCYDAEVEALVADTWKPDWSTYDGDCCASVLFRFEGGVHVNYLGTWTASWNRMDFRWRSEFTDGALIQQAQFGDLARIDFRPDLGLAGPRFKEAAEAEQLQPENLEAFTPFVDDTRALLGEFLAAVRGETEPVTTARDHLKSLLIVQACVESIESGGWVAMRDLNERFGLASGPLSRGDDVPEATPVAGPMEGADA